MIERLAAAALLVAAMLTGISCAGNSGSSAAAPPAPGDGPQALGPPERAQPRAGTGAFRVERIVKESGLIIEDLKAGSGDLCRSASETVKVHYRGTLEDGTEFDSSLGGKPVEFPLRDLIEGWKQGIPGMKVGGKRKLTVPWSLAYGERAVRGDDGDILIPARSNLVFEIELLGVKR